MQQCWLTCVSPVCCVLQAKEAAELEKERERGTPYESRTVDVSSLERKEERKSRS